VFKEGDITGDVNTTSKGILTPIPFLSRRVTKKNSFNRPGVKLPGSRTVIMDKTKASKHPRRKGEHGMMSRQHRMRDTTIEGTTRHTVAEKCTSENGLSPIFLGKIALEQ
jgi:hypothetical protein